MGMTGLLTLLLLALSRPLLAIYRDYHLVNEPKNWKDAQSYCRERFVDLASIENADDWARVRDVMAASGQQEAWIGMYDDVMEWRWALDDRYFCQGGEYQLNSSLLCLLEGNPEQLCGMLYKGELRSRECYRKRKALCYDKTTRQVIKVNNERTWEESLEYCRTNHTDLASIQNQQELDHLLGWVTYNDPRWVGLFRKGWRWSDGSDSSFSVWTKKPSDVGMNCTVAHQAGWSQAQCHLQCPFICSVEWKKKKKKMIKVVKVVAETDGNVDLSDSLVQEAFRKHLEKELQNHGVQEQLQLSWKWQLNGDVNMTKL